MRKLVLVAAVWGVLAVLAGGVARAQVNNGFGPDINRGVTRPMAPWSQTASFLPPVTHAANYNPSAAFEPIPTAGPATAGYRAPPTYVPAPSFVPNTSVPPGTLAVEPYPPGCATCPPPSGTNCKPLLPICKMPCDVVVGRGILGQPKAYVPNQPVRNFIRYWFP